MLFDIRSRGRRRTVQVVYLGLALLMGGGLVLLGTGTGNGFGGLFNAFGTNGSGSGQSAAVSSQEKAALKATQLRPTDPAAWSSLVTARWTSAGQGNNYNSSTGAYSTVGKQKLTEATQAWQKYLTLTKRPDPDVAILAARAYGQLADWPGAAGAWEIDADANPNVPKFYMCLAASAYAAKQTRKADLATAKALSLTPKASQATTKTTLDQAKASTTSAAQLAQTC